MAGCYMVHEIRNIDSKLSRHDAAQAAKKRTNRRYIIVLV